MTAGNRCEADILPSRGGCLHAMPGALLLVMIFSGFTAAARNLQSFLPSLGAPIFSPDVLTCCERIPYDLEKLDLSGVFPDMTFTTI